MRVLRHHPAARRPRRPGGFSLVELLVGLAVTSMLLLAIVGVFDAGSKVARVEVQTSDLQQSLRASHRQISRYVRMAGRGGLGLTLPGEPVYQGPALAMRNAAGMGDDSGDIAVGFADTPKAVTGSDILIVRGVFNTPVYQLDTLSPNDFTLEDGDGNPTTDPLQAVRGELVIKSLSNTGVPQDLSPFDEAKEDDIFEALVLLSPMDERIVAVVEFDPANSTITETDATVAFRVQGMNHSEYSDLYVSGAGDEPVLPIGMNAVANVGILEEYRFYIREPLEPLPGLPDPTPTLSMARMYPGTEIPYLGNVANAAVDLAENVLDLQVGLAFDTPLGPDWTDRNGDTVVDEHDMVIYETIDPEDPGDRDDYLFNNPNDDPEIAPWNGSDPQPPLYFVRLNLLARTGGRERNHQSPELLGYEDVQPLRVLNWNSFEERMFRRRFQRTIIELRNL